MVRNVVPNLFHIADVDFLYIFLCLSLSSFALYNSLSYITLLICLQRCITNTHAPPLTPPPIFLIRFLNLFYWSHVIFVFYVYILFTTLKDPLFLLFVVDLSCVQISRPKPSNDRFFTDIFFLYSQYVS